MKPESRCDVIGQMEYKSSYGSNRVRVIRLRRIGSIPLGFSVRGGKEHGTGIFVSEVQVGSEAHQQGLQIGDQILRVNGFNIEHAIHEEVLNLLRAKPGVVLKVKSVGMIPVKNNKKDPLTWKIVDPTQSCTSLMNGSSSSCTSSLEEQNDAKITINAVGANGLGCRSAPAINGFSNENTNSNNHCYVANTGNTYTDNGHSQYNGSMKGCNTQVIKVSATVHAANDSTVSDSIRECGDGMENSEEDICSSQRNCNSDKEIQGSKIVEEHSEEEANSTEHTIQSIGKKHFNGHREDFLLELQKCGERRNLMRDESSEQSSLSSEDSRRTQKAVITTEKSRYENDICKRKQHEMLMEEFREAHKKMFSTECIQKMAQDRNSRQRKEEERSLYFRRQQMREKKTSPLPPPPPLESALVATHFNSESDKDKSTVFSRNTNKVAEIIEEETHDSTASEEGSICQTSKLQGSSYIRPHSPNPHVFVDPSRHAKSIIGYKSSEINSEDILPLTSKQERRQCFPITDSRGLEPKPPQIYFEKSPNSKPLVTIGTYPNSTQQNRFLFPPANTNNDMKSRQNHCGSKGECPNTTTDENSSYKNNSNFAVTAHPLNHSSSSSSITSDASGSSSSSSSKPKSPFSYSSAFRFPTVNNSRTLKLTSSQNNSVFNVPNVVIKESTNNHPTCNLAEKSGNLKRTELGTKKYTENNASKSVVLKGPTSAKIEFQLHKEFTDEQIGGREVKTLYLNKKGPLNMRVEGGNNSTSDGRIIVSEIWEGDCVLQNGSVETGDQLLMVDNTPLIGVSLTVANAALRNAMCNSEKQLRLVIAKAQSPG